MSDNLPPLGPADLLVESGQGFVEGWTIQRVKDYAAAAVAAERERCARIVERHCGAWDDDGYALAAAIRGEQK